MKSPLHSLIVSACNEYAPTDQLCPCIVSAMAKNDSLFATAGVGARTKNPGNMRCVADIFMPNGTDCVGSLSGSFSAFQTLEEGVRQNVALYIRKYAGKAPDEVTRVWAGSPRSEGYWKDIRSCYPT